MAQDFRHEVQTSSTEMAQDLRQGVRGLPKRALECTEQDGVCAQRRRQEKKGPMFAHASLTLDGVFDWGETMYADSDVEVTEDRETFIKTVRSANQLVVWKGIYWGQILGLRREICDATDMWACMASLQAFVPKLSQFDYKISPPTRMDGSTSVVGQLSSLYGQWHDQRRLRYIPLNGGKYSWETKRGWSADELMTPIVCAQKAIPAPSWMDKPVDLSKDTAWLLRK